LVLLNQPVPVSAETKPKHVLVLSSHRPTSPVTYRWSLGIRSVFESASPHGIKIDIEYLDIARFNDDQYLKMLLDVYQYKYSKLKPDLIISVYNSALDFMIHYGADLFAGVPIVFFDVERSFIENRSFRAGMAGSQRPRRGRIYSDRPEGVQRYIRLNIHQTTLTEGGMA
jgi:hypothetical protein